MGRTGQVVAVTAGVLVASVLTACAGPDADPEKALRLLCGEDATISEEEGGSDQDDLVDGNRLSCSFADHTAVATKVNRDIQDFVEVEAAEFESGNGNNLVWAFVETDDGAGTAVYLYPPGLEDADIALLDPLDDEGWEIGPE